MSVAAEPPHGDAVWACLLLVGPCRICSLLRILRHDYQPSFLDLHANSH